MRKILVIFVFFSLLFLEAISAKSKYEPKRGCYIGAVLDWAGIASDSKYKKYNSFADKFDAAIKDFNALMGKKHSLFNCFIFFPHGADWEDEKYYGKYPSWDKDPCDWAGVGDYVEACERNDAGCIITIEPWIVDNYLAKWEAGNPAYDAVKALAIEVNKAKTPIFIRFAHEMNGSWYPWCSWIDKNQNVVLDDGEKTNVSPEKYILMYRNFVTLFKKYAGNAAFIWCPNQGWLGQEYGVDLYTPYYPGDDVVDWMGLDFYERGWDVKWYGQKNLWGRKFAYGLENDMNDDPDTRKNESVNFYSFCKKKRKPILICETGACLTFRKDFTDNNRKEANSDWKMGYWNDAEQGWLYNVYSTSYFTEKNVAVNIDREYPLIKGIVWFQQPKYEHVMLGEDVSRYLKSESKYHVYYDSWCDYRIGYNSLDAGETGGKKFPEEIKLYKGLIDNSYFLTNIKK